MVRLVPIGLVYGKTYWRSYYGGTAPAVYTTAFFTPAVDDADPYWSINHWEGATAYPWEVVSDAESPVGLTGWANPPGGGGTLSVAWEDALPEVPTSPVPSSPGNAPAAPGSPLGAAPGNAPTAPESVMAVDPGTPPPDNSVKTVPQNLTNEEKAVVLANIGAAADAAVVHASGPETIAGTKTFSGQLEAPALAATTDKSLMNRGLVSVESLLNVGSIKLLGPFTAIGTGASMTVAGDDIALFVAATANATARFVLARNLTSQSVWGGATIDCSKNFDLAFSLAAYVAQAGTKIRLSYGAPGAAPNADTDPISGKGWGIEFARLTDSSFRMRLFAYNSSLVWSSGTYDVTGYANKSFLFRKQAGTISLWAESLTGRIDTTATPVLTMTGAPTTGSTSNATVSLEIANGATSSVGSALRLLSQPISRVWQ